MKQWAALVRVSHMGDRRANSDAFHADREQLDPIETWAKAKPAPLEVMPPELGVSGGLPLEQRPSLLRAVEGVESGAYAGIVVAYLSRLGRNVAEQLRVWDRVEAAGGQVVAIREGIDTSTASGRLHRNLLVSIDAHVRESAGERFEERRRLATEAGIWQRRQTPRGYRKDKRTRKLVPDRRADSVRAAARDLLAGATISELARRLQMTTSGVRQMLRNRVYLGELKVGKHVNPKAHPPLLDLETFEAVQDKLAHGARPPRNGNGPALCAGVARCESCGHLMTRGNSRGEPVYACPARHSGKHCPRPTAVMTARLDAYVEPIALAELSRLQVTATEGDRVEVARRKVADAESDLAGFLDAIEGTDIDAEAVRQSAAKRQGVLDEAREALRVELARQPAVPTVGDGAAVWEDLSAHDRNQLLRALLAAVVVRPAGRGRKVPMADRARVLALGADLGLPQRDGHNATGIVPMPFEDLDGEAVLGVPASEDALEGASGAG
jgi:site-specific DNA recombinase